MNLTPDQIQVLLAVLGLGFVGGIAADIGTAGIKFPIIRRQEDGSYTLDLGTLGSGLVGAVAAVSGWFLDVEKPLLLVYGLALGAGVAGRYVLNGIRQRTALENTQDDLLSDVERLNRENRALRLRLQRYEPD